MARPCCCWSCSLRSWATSSAAPLLPSPPPPTLSPSPSTPPHRQDAVVLLLDVLYEKLGVFKRQYWQGVITMQNPFDMYAIQVRDRTQSECGSGGSPGLGLGQHHVWAWANTMCGLRHKSRCGHGRNPGLGLGQSHVWAWAQI
eukprot:351992-Chlamydomonas_euryale.AAC.1